MYPHIYASCNKHNNIATDICIQAPTKTVPTKVATGIKEPRDEPRQKRYPLVVDRGKEGGGGV